MEKAATLNLRVNPEVKHDAERVLDQLGISMSAAITMYLRQIALTGGIPFALKLPAAPRRVDADAMADAELASVLAKRAEEAASGSGVSPAEARAGLLA